MVVLVLNPMINTHEITPVLEDGLSQTNREVELLTAMMYLMVRP